MASMTPYDLSSIDYRLDLISKLLSISFKVGVLTGGACLLFYCYRLDYFPVGLSVGDGFLLILLATSFGIVYGLFTISLTALGLWLTPVLRPLQRKVVSMQRRFSKRKPKQPLKLVRPDFHAFMFGVLGLFFIWAFHRLEPSAIWTLPATSFALSVVFAAYRDASLKLEAALHGEATTVNLAETNKHAPYVDKEKLKTERTLSIIAIFTLPLLVGGVSGELLEAAMRFANIKKGPSYVLLRAPYNSFVPSSLQAKTLTTPPDYTTYENIDVMFSGMGQKSVIEFKHDDQVRRLEVPNESMLIISRSK